MAAVQGDEETVQTRARAAIEVAGAHGVSIAGALGNWALAQIDLASGRPAAAVHRLRPTARADVRNTHLVVQVTATPTSSRPPPAPASATRPPARCAVFERWAESTGSPDRRALAVRCRALLAPPGEADELFRSSPRPAPSGLLGVRDGQNRVAVRLRPAPRPPSGRGPRAPVQRAGHLRALRGPALGGPGAERTARGRRGGQDDPAEGGGGPHGPAVPDRPDGRRRGDQPGGGGPALPEPRTVEHHLRNIFAKLDIRSRVDLVRLLT